MKLRVLDLAEADLLRGTRFYERKVRGVGWYFLDSLSGEIESLHLYAGVHRKHLSQGALRRRPSRAPGRSDPFEIPVFFPVGDGVIEGLRFEPGVAEIEIHDGVPQGGARQLGPVQ